MGRHMIISEPTPLPPGLSVTIPVFHSERTLSRALESVRSCVEQLGAQAGLALEDPPDVEIVVVLDGPNEQCANIASDFSGAFTGSVHVVEIPHSGISRARNTGLRHAKYQNFTVLDADDELTPARLEEGLSEIAIPVVGRHKLVHDPGWVGDTVERDQDLNYSTLVIPTELARKIGGFDENIALANDLEFLARLEVQNVRVKLVDDIFVLRHLGPSHASADRQRIHRERFQVLRDVRDAIRENKEPYQRGQHAH